MKKYLVCMVLFSTLMVQVAGAEVFRLFQTEPEIKSYNETIDKSSGEKLYTSITVNQVGEQNGKKFLRITGEKKGKIGGSKVPIIQKTEAYYFAEPTLRPYYSKTDTYSQSGQLQKSTSINFSSAEKKAFVTVTDKLQNKSKNSSQTFFNDLVEVNGISYAVENYNFAERKDFKFHYISNEPSMYSLTLVYRGSEKVTTPAGTFDCVKLEMTIDLGLLGVAGAFIPKTYWWYTASAPHSFVKYEGLDGGLGSPYVITQSTK